MNNKLKIVYMGTPDFAVPPLLSLNHAQYDIQLVLSQPDRPMGRGRKLTMQPVKRAAVELGIPVIQPSSLKTDEIKEQLKALSPDFFVVCAYGHILSKELLDIPKFGCVNIHASLLPQYRGAAPIQWAIINNEFETGITTMLMDIGMDTGDILLKASTQIHRHDTSQILHDRLSQMGADLIGKTLEGIVAGTLKGVAQDHKSATYAPMLKKKDGHINWCDSADSIEAFIRGVTPWPGAYCFCGEKRFKIFKAMALQTDVVELPGTIIKCSCDQLHVATKEGILIIEEIQESSGKRLAVKDYLCGCSSLAGTHFC